MQSLCTLRNHCCQWPRNTRYQADAALAIGDCDNETDAEAFATAARAAGVPVNVIDKPAFCDFSFGAIVNRSPLVIGISTDGGAPMFAQALRAKLEMKP
jgi:uroporphyrin-III C-methyltransferase / precorrin-2 dehydrogenase / sirohydrochlorin ferrochelatase